MKTKINVINFGRIVEEIPASKVECAMTHIYVSDLTDEAIDYLTDLAQKLPVEKLQSCIIHLNDSTENLLEFFEVR